MFPIKNCRDFRKKLKSHLIVCNIRQSHLVASLLPTSISQVKYRIRSLLTRHLIVKSVTVFLIISLFREALFLSRTWSSIQILWLYRYWALWMFCFRKTVWVIPILMSITLNIRVSTTSTHWRIFSFRQYSFLLVGWGVSYSDTSLPLFPLFLLLSILFMSTWKTKNVFPMTWNKGRILMCLSLRIKILCSRCETGVTSYKSKDIYRSDFRQIISADCFYMVMRNAQWD